MVRFAPFHWATMATALTGSVVSSEQHVRLLQSDNGPGTDMNVVDDLIFAEDDLTTLAAAFSASGLVGALCTDCNYTLFAPTDEAFAKVDNATLARLLEPSFILHLQNLLSFHATVPSADRVLAADLEDGMVLEMVNEENVTLAFSEESAAVVGSHFEAQIVETDIVADNGVLHKVDTVFIPDFLVTDLVGLATTSVGEQFTILFEFFELANVGELIGDNVFTVLAPTDEAFLALGNETLTYLRSSNGTADLLTYLTNHVIQGVVPSVLIEDGTTVMALSEYKLNFSVTNGNVVVNDATVVVANVLASNGIVHAIDKVLIEPFAPSAPNAPAAPAAPAAAPVKAPSDSTSGAGSMPSFAAATTAVAIGFATI